MNAPRPQRLAAVEIGSLAIEGFGRGWGARAAASFERSLPAALAGLEGPVHLPRGPITAPPPGGMSPEAYGRAMARALALALKP